MKNTRNPRSDHFVFSKKTSFMQRAADLVRSGHIAYVQGQVSIDRAAFLAEKFEVRYAISVTKLQASRARQAGGASTRLLLLAQESCADQLHWLLLQYPGDVADTTEKWRDAISDRITITGYELVRLTKPNESNPVWTWRYSRSRHDELRSQFIACIRQKRDRDLAQLIHTTWRTPGFHGAREQVKKFSDLIKAEWKRSRGADEAIPEIPGRIGYVRRLPDVGMRLGALRRSMMAAGSGATNRSDSGPAMPSP
jgi:hypothetical protein